MSFHNPTRNAEPGLEWRWLLALIALLIAIVPGVLFARTFIDPASFNTLSVSSVGTKNTYDELAHRSPFMPILLAHAVTILSVILVAIFAFPMGGILGRRHPILLSLTIGILTHFGISIGPLINQAIQGKSLLHDPLPLGLLYHRGFAGGVMVAALSASLILVILILRHREASSVYRQDF